MVDFYVDRSSAFGELPAGMGRNKPLRHLGRPRDQKMIMGDGTYPWCVAAYTRFDAQGDLLPDGRWVFSHIAMNYGNGRDAALYVQHQGPKFNGANRRDQDGRPILQQVLLVPREYPFPMTGMRLIDWRDHGKT